MNFLISKKRKASEYFFKSIGFFSVFISVCFLIFILLAIIYRASNTFFQAELLLPIEFKESYVKEKRYMSLLKQSLYKQVPEVKTRKDKKYLYSLLSNGAYYVVENYINNNDNIIGKKMNILLPLSDEADQFLKTKNTNKEYGKINSKQIAYLSFFTKKNMIENNFNWRFFYNNDSREPELAGIKNALLGSLIMISVTFILSFVLGVLTAIYLEEFVSSKNKIVNFIEININNLASVPSVVFGLLGLMIFINFMQLERSSLLVGSLVLTLMTLPTIIISSRTAIRSVPANFKDAAIALGASRFQAIFHHRLPYAMPGIITGNVIGIIQALGESAPLLMIGMVAFIVDPPTSIMSPGTSIPVQIFIWSESPEIAWVDKTAALILVLMVILLIINFFCYIIEKKI